MVIIRVFVHGYHKAWVSSILLEAALHLPRRISVAIAVLQLLQLFFCPVGANEPQQATASRLLIVTRAGAREDEVLAAEYEQLILASCRGVVDQQRFFFFKLRNVS